MRRPTGCSVPDISKRRQPSSLRSSAVDRVSCCDRNDIVYSYLDPARDWTASQVRECNEPDAECNIQYRQKEASDLASTSFAISANGAERCDERRGLDERLREQPSQWHGVDAGSHHCGRWPWVWMAQHECGVKQRSDGSTSLAMDRNERPVGAFEPASRLAAPQLGCFHCFLPHGLERRSLIRGGCSGPP